MGNGCILYEGNQNESIENGCSIVVGTFLLWIRERKIQRNPEEFKAKEADQIWPGLSAEKQERIDGGYGEGVKKILQVIRKNSNYGEESL